MGLKSLLLDVAQKVGLDADRAAKILESDEFATEVRNR
jgi:predicted DsbA family dithiol-disulfide isomerase